MILNALKSDPALSHASHAYAHYVTLVREGIRLWQTQASENARTANRQAKEAAWSQLRSLTDSSK